MLISLNQKVSQSDAPFHSGGTWTTRLPAERRNLGSLLMGTILKEAKAAKARMAVLETQTCNETAIAFYRRNGFEIIGFDLYSYSNTDTEKHEVRVEMGKPLV